jgi:hypothetical protein
MAAACVILLDAVVVVVPQALADPNKTASASPSPQSLVTAATLVEDPSAAAGETPTSSQLPFFATTIVVPSPTPSPTPSPVARKTTPKPTYRDTVTNARAYVKNRIGATQYNCVNIVWYHESRWSWRASNPNSGAYGIPQALPGSKMAAFGSNWRTSPLTQVKWGIWYVNSRYGSACGAYAFWSQNHWY